MTVTMAMIDSARVRANRALEQVRETNCSPLAEQEYKLHLWNVNRLLKQYHGQIDTATAAAHWLYR